MRRQRVALDGLGQQNGRRRRADRSAASQAWPCSLNALFVTTAAAFVLFLEWMVCTRQTGGREREGGGFVAHTVTRLESKHCTHHCD